MKYTNKNGIRTVEVPVKDFRVILYDARKKAMGKNRCTGGFFATYDEPGVKFTLPVGHLVADYAATEKWTRHYCEERGKFDGDKFRFNSGTWSYMNPLHGKEVSTLVISDGVANILDVAHVPEKADYAVSGVPIMRNGEDVIFKTYVQGQGWDASSLYATYHVFVGIKEKDANTLYIMGMKTTTGNMIRSMEAYKKFKALGFRDVIKLDGGGSFFFNAEGNELSTYENRRICTILDFGPK